MTQKYGLVGCGSISRFHFAALEKTGAPIAMVADLNEAAGRPFAEKYGARFTKNYQDIVNDPEVTAVAVLTSSRFHREICETALAAGKHVICEKTMTENAADSRALALTARASGQLFFAAFMKRFFPAAQKARALVPALGTLFSANVRSFQQWGNFYDAADEGDFGFVYGAYGGAVMKCAGSHMIDMALYLLGRPESLYAHVDYLKGTRFDRKCTAIFEYPGGMTASFETAAHPLKRVGFCRDSWDEYIEINGVNGRLGLYFVMWDEPERNGCLLTHYDNATESVTEYRFPPANPFDLELAYFNRQAEAGLPVTPCADDGFNVDAVIDAMERSHAGKHAMTIDWLP